LVDYTHYQSDSPRFTNNRIMVDDLTFKTVHELSDRTQILAKFNYYREDSKLGYQGLTESMYAQNPRTTPFTNDHLDFTRIGAHVAVNYMFTANLTSTTNFFGHYIDRPWTRQFQQGIDVNGNPVGAPVLSNNIPATSYAVVPANGRFTNAREYLVYGVEPRFHYVHRLFGISAEADFGARYMYEQSDRLQFRNVASGAGASFSCFTPPPGATTCLGESNFRTTNAYALFFQERLIIGKFTITPGFRVEHIRYEANNRLANNGDGNHGEARFTEVLPGIGATYSLNKNHMIFAGVHRGMSPPLVSDAVTGTGAAADLDPELSWTYEIGARGTPTHWAGYELTLFELDFQNQIISQSVAGGVGATLTSAGRTRHRGIEFATKMDLLDAVTGQNNDQDVIFDVNYTWIADAEFRGARNSSVTGDALLPGEPTTVSVTGNRLPYSPRNMLTAGLGYTHRPFGFSARIETQCISDMFGDDRNTVTPTPNGQRGLISGWCALNAAINQYVKPIRTTFFFVGKNMLGQDYIVDRTRGIYSGLPALWQAGAKWTF
jgi:Fe(3+) dicitrate transport protein